MPIRDDSAGSYGTWDNNDLSWIDWLKANASDGGNALSNLGRNLVDGFSPIGTSEQGNMSLQVPPIVSGIADSYGRLAGTPNNPGNAYNLSGVPELDAPIQHDMSNVLLSLYGGNALNPLAKAPAGSVGMFAGRGAKTADHAALARAEEMAGQGIPREQIWNDTGWFKGADDKWRFEIDDSGQKLLKTREELARLGRPIASDQVFAHDKLYAAYPELADTPWYLTPSIENGGASFDKVRGIRVGDGEGFSYGKSGMGGMTLHEQQHGIQDIEGFARGGSREFGNKLDDVQREARNAYELSRTRQASGVRTPEDEIAAELGIAEPVLIKPWDDLSQREQLGWYEAGRGRAYNRLAGETEARTVQSRMNLTPEERQARPPWLDYDVPEAEQIVRLLSDTGKPSILGSAMAGAGDAPLPMDHASRMERAREMGFDVDTPLYHGTIHDFDSFDPTLNGKYNEPHGDAVHFSSNPRWSNGYADIAGHLTRARRYYDAEDARIASNKTKWPWQRNYKETPLPEIVRSENGMVYKTFVRPGKQFDVEHWTSGFDDLEAAEVGRRPNTWSVHDAVKHARENGYDSVRVRNVASELGIGSRIADSSDEFVIFDPSNIRSVNAAFDPARAGENGLLLSDNRPSLLGSALATGGEDYDLPEWLRF